MSSSVDEKYLNDLIKDKQSVQDRWYAAGVGSEGKYKGPKRGGRRKGGTLKKGRRR